MGQSIDERGGTSMYSHEIQKAVLLVFQDLVGDFLDHHPDDAGIAVGQSEHHPGLVGYIYRRPDVPISEAKEVEKGLVVVFSNTLDPALSDDFAIEAMDGSGFRESDSEWGRVKRDSLNEAVSAAWDNLV